MFALPRFNPPGLLTEVPPLSDAVIFAAPADIELLDDPIRPHWIIEGAPQARSKRLAQSADGTAMIMAWSCTAGRFEWHYTVDETVHIISGEVHVTDEKGEIRRLGPGDMAFFPAGSRSIWHVPYRVRKLAVCRPSMPRPLGTMLRAWNKLIETVASAVAANRRGEGASVRRSGERVASA